MILTQQDIEQEMLDSGRERARLMMAKNEESGRANANAYATPIFRRFVQPLADMIRDAEGGRKAGRQHAHLALLKGLEPETVGYIAVRYMLVSLLQDPGEDKLRRHTSALGKLIQDEQVLRQFKNAEPERYWMLQQVLERRQSRDTRHHMILAHKDMRSLDLEPISWGPGNRDQMGAYLIERLRALGMLEAWHHKVKVGKGYRTVPHIRLSWEVLEMLDGMRDMIEETMPYFLPCVERPKDWLGLHGGGFHTLAMQQRAPVAVLRGNPGGGDITVLTKALNVLQSVRWQVNGEVLDIARGIARIMETHEIVSVTPPPLPEKPHWLNDDTKVDELDEQRALEFRAWKWATAQAHTERKLKGQKFGRMKMAFFVAEKLRHQPEVYFVYFADHRGRCYPYTSGISPQGSDLQKALLRFAEGKPLLTPEAKAWFCIHGANKFGVDKVSFDERLQWVQENEELILACAEDPINNRGWLEADCPFQFLAWALEYKEWKQYGAAFQSHIPVGMDGSCNGLQNFSAMLRDEKGGVSTNIVPGPAPRDIYQDVADRAMERVKAAPDDDMKTLWINHGISRKVVKRSVMTLPYGSTKYSSRDFILQDYLREERPEDIPRESWAKASSWLNEHVWAAIGDVVVKAREAMDWLQTCSGEILDQYSSIQWKTPTGFVVHQDYWASKPGGTVRVLLFGGARWNVQVAGDGPNRRKHRNGIAPNFIHSMDASHMQLAALRSKEEGITSLAMIHDDFGTHAADAHRFSQIIREVFLEMYQDHDWLQDFYDRYTTTGVFLPDPPDKGSLDLEEVLKSQYFFA